MPSGEVFRSLLRACLQTFHTDPPRGYFTLTSSVLQFSLGQTDYTVESGLSGQGLSLFTGIILSGIPLGLLPSLDSPVPQ